MLGGAAALRGRESSCIKCAKCVSACPMGLEPYLMAKLSRRKLWERLEAEWVTNCIECGCVSLPVRRIFRCWTLSEWENRRSGR